MFFVGDDFLINSKNVPYFDGHCDTISKMLASPEADRLGLRSFNGHINLNMLSQFSKAVQFFAFYDKSRSEDSFDKQLELFRREVAENSDIVTQCFCANDIKKATESGKIAAILAIEGAELISCSEDRLDEAYRAGVRDIMLTWNFQNILSGSNNEGSELGLSEKGKSFVSHALDLHMLVDVSHISDAGFYDILNICTERNVPFIASHSNSRAICSHKRNLTDDMFKNIVAVGGVAGLNMYKSFIINSGSCRMFDIIPHIEHFLELGGEKNIALGCDLDGSVLPEDFTNVSDLPLLYNELLRLNYPERLVNDIFFNNFMRVAEKVLI